MLPFALLLQGGRAKALDRLPMWVLTLLATHFKGILLATVLISLKLFNSTSLNLI